MKSKITYTVAQCQYVSQALQQQSNVLVQQGMVPTEDCFKTNYRAMYI